MVMVVAATAAAGGGGGGGASERLSVRCNLLVFHRPFPAPARQQPARPHRRLYLCVRGTQKLAATICTERIKIIGPDLRGGVLRGPGSQASHQLNPAKCNPLL